MSYLHWFLAHGWGVTYSKAMRKSTSGFTIVELLIVIVVIAILATISIVAYSGIQQRAHNTQTVSAVETYIKALHLYKADNGQYPPATSCLGVGYPSGRCHSGGAYVENQGNLNTTYLAQYFGSSPPTPALNLGQYDSSTQLGGAVYVWSNAAYGGTNNGGIGLYQQGSTACPSIGNLALKTTTPYSDGSGAWCRYAMD
jgi:prepilin-type N-terminal cleavage/methylation domain-containing protein